MKNRDNKEKLRFFWMGKTKRVRTAVEEYLSQFNTGIRVTQNKLSQAHGCCIPSIRRTIKELFRADLLGEYVDDFILEDYKKNVVGCKDNVFYDMRYRV